MQVKHQMIRIVLNSGTNLISKAEKCKRKKVNGRIKKVNGKI